MSDIAEQRRLAVQLEILDRLMEVDLHDEELAVALVGAAATLIARSHPGKPNAAAKRLIEENYAGATADLIAERAMSPEGVVFALGAAQKLGSIALSYSPLAHVKSDIDHDKAVDGTTTTTTILAKRVRQSCADASANGVSPFGAAATAIFAAVAHARETEVGTFRTARVLIDALYLVLDAHKPPTKKVTKKVVEAAPAAKLAEMMGVSTATARRYLPVARHFMKSNPPL